MDEALEVIKRLFTDGNGGTANFQGEYYSLANCPLSPPCAQTPHLPILVGGNGEKRTLRSCAKYADICNIDFNNPGGVDVFRHKISVLERHCESLGRDPAHIKKTVLIPLRLEDDEAKAKELRQRRGEWVLYGPPAQVIDTIGAYRDAGCEEMMFLRRAHQTGAFRAHQRRRACSVPLKLPTNHEGMMEKWPKRNTK